MMKTVLNTQLGNETKIRSVADILLEVDCVFCSFYVSRTSWMYLDCFIFSCIRRLTCKEVSSKVTLLSMSPSRQESGSELNVLCFIFPVEREYGGIFELK